LETLKVFCFGILKFGKFQFFSCHFGGFKIFCVKFSQAKKWGTRVFLHVNFESFLFSYFKILESLILFLSFWRFHMGGNNVGGIVLNLGVSKFVLMEFKDLQLCS
jgi:hypothetical protein